MSENYLIQRNTLTEIADAVRDINGETEQYTPAEIAGKIRKVKTVIDQLEESKIIATATGESIVLTDSSDKELEGLVLYGKTTQNGTPSPTNPIPLVSVGDGGVVNVLLTSENMLVLTEQTGYISNVDGTIASASAFLASHYIPVGQESLYVVTPSYDSSNSQSYGLRVGMYDKNKAWISNVQIASAKKKINPPANVAYIRMSVLKEWDTALYAEDTDEYESSNSQILNAQTPNGLPGVPVTSGGNYTDENGQQYVSDYKDYERGVYVRRVTTAIGDPVRVTAVADGILDAETGLSGFRIYFNLTNLADSANRHHSIASAFVYNGDWRRINAFSISNTCDVLMAQVPNDFGITTIAEAKTWMVENNVVFLYPLATPIETPLPAEEIAAYKALHTNKPVTTILNDGGAGMSVSYVADTKAYIDNKFAALEAAILSTGGNV